MIRYRSFTLTLLVWLISTLPVHAKELELDPAYVRLDGAIMTMNSGNLVDPYFPTKSLMLAQDSGMDVDQLANGWINWMLARQDSDGLFSRYCFKDDGFSYSDCEIADADDSMMAMWIELLYRMAPTSGMPQDWQKSVEKAEYQLASLYNPQANIYYISKTMQAGLLMDNIEIYAAFKHVESDAFRLGDGKKALAYRAMAKNLKSGIMKNFWDAKNKRYIASTQVRTEETFYPDTVVQLFPMLHRFNAPNALWQSSQYNRWMNHHRKEWFELIGNSYPWGIFAVLAESHNDIKTAGCWLKEVTPQRNAGYWSILEETSYQIVQWKLNQRKTAPDFKCDEDSL